MNDFWQLVKHTFFRIVWAFLPLMILVALLHLPEGTYAKDIKNDISIRIGLTIIFTSVQLVILWKTLIPFIAKNVSLIFSSEGNFIEEDPHLENARVLLKKGMKKEALQHMKDYTDNNRKLLRAWLARVDFVGNEIGDYPESIAILEEALECARWNKQDKAFLLYRIGKIYADKLNKNDQADEHWKRAVTLYPRTIYGKESAKKMAQIY